LLPPLISAQIETVF